MSRTSSEDRYRHRPAVRRIILVSGDNTRTLTIRPWIAGLVATFGVVLSLGVMGASGYLIFRDDLINTAFTRRAELQQAYEDRIAALRSEIDRITSRQVLDQISMEEKVDRLLAIQASIDDRQKQVSELIDRAKASGLIETDDHAAADPVTTGSVNSYAAADTNMIDQQFAALTEAAPSTRSLSAAPAELPDVTALMDRIDKIDDEQTAAVNAITAAADAKVDKVADIVTDLGMRLKIKSKDASDGEEVEGGLGGPYIPLTRSEALAEALSQADAAVNRLGQVRLAVGKLPLEKPLIGASMTSNFGSRADPFLGSPAFHAGIDFRAPSGDPVYATAPGVIAAAGVNGGYGNLVEIDHGNGLTTRYAHLSKFAVEAGEKVEKGQVIGYVGSTGRSTGPHLHYETRVKGEPINPANYINAGAKITALLN